MSVSQLIRRSLKQPIVITKERWLIWVWLFLSNYSVQIKRNIRKTRKNEVTENKLAMDMSGYWSEELELKKKKLEFFKDFRHIVWLRRKFLKNSCFGFSASVFFFSFFSFFFLFVFVDFLLIEFYNAFHCFNWLFLFDIFFFFFFFVRPAFFTFCSAFVSFFFYVRIMFFLLIRPMLLFCLAHVFFCFVRPMFLFLFFFFFVQPMFFLSFLFRPWFFGFVRPLNFVVFFFGPWAFFNCFLFFCLDHVLFCFFGRSIFC